ncbi:MAG: anti-sigma factor [Rhodospirillaceae bacterium]|nr:anti-sigma factor [Rhodospirillaceae bacterium]MBT5564524.1 anti-sigma factor [Rhodospirillaceae bacterium]
MNASHHPSDDLLWSYAAGSLDEPSSILIATHQSLCPACRAIVAKAESLGGELFEDLASEDIEAGSLAAVLARLDDIEDSSSIAAETIDDEAENISVPRPLKDYLPASVPSLPWRWLGPGVRYTAINTEARGPKIGLLRIAPGTKVPMHGHSGNEMTMVLAGGFTDATGSYQRGDVEAADGGLVHQPVADAGEECLCLVVTEGELQPTGMIAKILQPFFRF